MPGVVYEDVDRTEATACILEGRTHLIGVADIGSHCVTDIRAEFAGGRSDTRKLAPEQRNACAFSQQPLRDGNTDAPARACDECVPSR
ncbi:hypothetical protein GCM10011488_26570 [Steroidobacter agaridevorans]|nr:hypothetical protein GCM10011488_26570 [Steroidobacter agaridevorans]